MVPGLKSVDTELDKVAEYSMADGSDLGNKISFNGREWCWCV